MSSFFICFMLFLFWTFWKNESFIFEEKRHFWNNRCFFMNMLKKWKFDVFEKMFFLQFWQKKEKSENKWKLNMLKIVFFVFWKNEKNEKLVFYWKHVVSILFDACLMKSFGFFLYKSCQNRPTPPRINFRIGLTPPNWRPQFS